MHGQALVSVKDIVASYERTYHGPASSTVDAADAIGDMDTADEFQNLMDTARALMGSWSTPQAQSEASSTDGAGGEGARVPEAPRQGSFEAGALVNGGSDVLAQMLPCMCTCVHWRLRMRKWTTGPRDTAHAATNGRLTSPPREPCTAVAPSMHASHLQSHPISGSGSGSSQASCAASLQPGMAAVVAQDLATNAQRPPLRSFEVPARTGSTSSTSSYGGVLSDLMAFAFTAQRDLQQTLSALSSSAGSHDGGSTPHLHALEAPLAAPLEAVPAAHSALAASASCHDSSLARSVHPPLASDGALADMHVGHDLMGLMGLPGIGFPLFCFAASFSPCSI
jgi:hypothetical protein